MSAEHNDNIPSGRIRFALEAMREIEALDWIDIEMDKNFRISMGGRCFACCGGAARLKLESRLRPDAFIDEEDVAANKFEVSLDYAREGRIDLMFRYMRLPESDGKKLNRPIPIYSAFREEFYRHMNFLADDLEKGGY